MTSFQPELWVDRADAAVAFYAAAFGARVLHQVGAGEDIVAQLAVGNAVFWVSSGGAEGRLGIGMVAPGIGSPGPTAGG